MSENSGESFIRASRLSAMPVSAQKLGQPQPSLEWPIPPGAELAALPDPNAVPLPELSLPAAIERRSTVRKFGLASLELPELSYLLWATQGVKTITAQPTTLRTVPSAGARHAFETFLVVDRVTGLTPGLYRYAALQHALLPIDLSPDHSQAILRTFTRQEHIFAGAVVWIWVAVPARMEFRHPVRGYRYLFLDAGHICQNLYLAAELFDCGVCALGVFEDEVLNPLLGLDGQTSFAAYGAVVGRKP